MGKMSLEEKALRYADGFLTDERLWWHGDHVHPNIDATCVGILLNNYRRKTQPQGELADGFIWASKVMGVLSVTKWNDGLPSFEAMKSALKARIKHYKGLRT